MVMAKRNLAGAAGAENLTDEVLLERFTSHQEETAFADLVRRYGRLVLGVCRRVLQHEQDAEDAFQAVFCVLARRAGSIRQPGAVGAWLHAVAYRIARKAQARRGRQPVPTADLSDLPAAEGPPEWVWQELRPILDEEVNRLPEKYRQAFILCFLEGQTNEQAANQLGCPLGTILSRLARARERLRARLTRRGLVLSSGALAVALATEAAAAEVPPDMSRKAIWVALAFADGNAAGTVPPRVSSLAKGSLPARTHKGRTWISVGLLAGLLVVIAGTVILFLLFRRPPASSVPPHRTDRELLQGNWSGVRAEMNGLVAEDFNFGLVFAGDQCTMTFPGFGQIVTQFELDPGGIPRRSRCATRWGLCGRAFIGSTGTP